MLERLERACGLHWRVKIIYVVDGFLAILHPEEGYPYKEIQAHGKDITEALSKLDGNISDKVLIKEKRSE